MSKLLSNIFIASKNLFKCDEKYDECKCISTNIYSYVGNKIM